MAAHWALYDVYRDAKGQPQGVDIVYQAIGRMTRRLVGVRAGDRLEIWGPLGNGFPPTEAEHLIMVAGGIGQTPFLALGAALSGPGRVWPAAAGCAAGGQGLPLLRPAVRRLHLRLGRLPQAGVEVCISTDDGSAGHRGSVVDLVPPLVESSELPCRIVACGPERMLHATVTMAARLSLPCQVSLESPMACGIGICFSCVTKIRDQQGEWDYRRICVEGPVFDAAEVEF